MKYVCSYSNDLAHSHVKHHGQLTTWKTGIAATVNHT